MSSNDTRGRLGATIPLELPPAEAPVLAARDASLPPGGRASRPGHRGGGPRGCTDVLRGVRERAGPAARALAGRHAALRGQHPGQPARGVRRLGGRPHPSRLDPGGHGAGGRRRAQQHRGLGGQPPVRQREHRRPRRRRPPRVARTLLVGDEPRDIVFAGPGGNRAFITHGAPRAAAHAIRRSSFAPGAGDPQLTTPGIGARRRLGLRRDRPSAPRLGGTAGAASSAFFADTPRALATPTAQRSTWRRSTRATRPRPINETVGLRRLPGQRRQQLRAGAPGGVAGPDTQRTPLGVQRRPRSASSSSSTAPTGSTRSTATGRRSSPSACPTTTSSRSNANTLAAEQHLRRTSAPSSSTWS